VSSPSPELGEVSAFEREQAKLRLVTMGPWLAIFAALFAWQGAWGAAEVTVVGVTTACWLASVALLAWVVRRPGVDHLRRTIAILLDFIPITVAMLAVGELGTVVFYAYVFVMMGNGFRYGRAYLHFAQALAIAGFGTVALFSGFWREHVLLSVSLMLVLVLVPMYVGVLISRLQTSRQREAAARAAAEAANVAKSRFLAAASHDLRQPMQALSMYASVLDQPRPHPEARRIMQSIQLSVQTLESMFDGLLDVARLESGVVQPQMAAFALQPLLERIVEVERPLAAHKGLALRLVATSVAVRSDPALLERVLKNLVTNAIRYTERGGIVVGCRRAGSSRVRVQVVDSGVGVPAHEQQRIFEEYYQLAGASSEGLGLGLPIVKSLAGLLGHRVALESVPGSGSVFSIELERAEAAEAPAATPSAPPRPFASVCVAVVDDDAEIRRSVAVLLESWGCRCIAAADGAEIEARFGAEGLRPDALIVDYRLGGGRDGLQVIERLRAAFGAALPALLITGTPATARLAGAPYGVALATKPVPPGKLRAFLSTVPA
jgi:signal transduction histidine kinase/CheY-like chemotaxis protein